MDGDGLPTTYTEAPDFDDAGPPARVYLQPIAPPASLGLWGFFSSTFLVSTWLLGWWGSPASPPTFFEYAAFFGGVAQFASGLWSFKARDYIASALLTMWGTYWMAWGFVQALGAAGVVKIPPLDVANQGFAVWFIPLALFTSWGAIAALRENLPLFFLLATVGSGCAVICAGFWIGSPHWIGIGAWLFIIGAAWAWYVAAMIMLESAWGRVILPLGVLPWMKLPMAANIPGRRLTLATQYAFGQPGVAKGQ